jgi:hypothetical protein
LTAALLLDYSPVSQNNLAGHHQEFITDALFPEIRRRLKEPNHGQRKYPPPRGEFIGRNAYIVTMDPKLGDIPNGDVHVRNG